MVENEQDGLLALMNIEEDGCAANNRVAPRADSKYM